MTYPPDHTGKFSFSGGRVTNTTGQTLYSVPVSVERTRFSHDNCSHPSVAWLAYDVAANGEDTGLIGYGDSADDALWMLDGIRKFQRERGA